MQQIYTCKQVAERYAVSEDTVWRWIREGKLEAVRIGRGRNLRVTESALTNFENNTK